MLRQIVIKDIVNYGFDSSYSEHQTKGQTKIMRSVATLLRRGALENLRSDLGKTLPSPHAVLIGSGKARFSTSGAPILSRTDIKFTKRHEWISMTGGKDEKVGVTDYAQDALGDIAYVQLPEVGLEVKRYDEVGALESVKAASEIYAPLDGNFLSVEFGLIFTVACLCGLFCVIGTCRHDYIGKRRGRSQYLLD